MSYVPRRLEDKAFEDAKVAAMRDQDEDFEGIEETKEENYDFLTMKGTAEHLQGASAKYSENAKKLITELLISQTPSLIDREHLIEVASQQRERFFGCLSLPFSFFFFLTYAASTYWHED